jgi:hypothetical protein
MLSYACNALAISSKTLGIASISVALVNEQELDAIRQILHIKLPVTLQHMPILSSRNWMLRSPLTDDMIEQLLIMDFFPNVEVSRFAREILFELKQAIIGSCTSAPS